MSRRVTWLVAPGSTRSRDLRIEGGGGYVDVPGAPEECRIGTEFAVWQSVID